MFHNLAANIHHKHKYFSIEKFSNELDCYTSMNCERIFAFCQQNAHKQMLRKIRNF